MVASLFLVAAVFIFIFHTIVYKFKQSPQNFFNQKNVLFVTAHPDDECMFFSPTILSAKNAFLTCLSTGNYDNLGEIRSKELFKSCSILGIKKENVSIVDKGELQEGPDEYWDEDIVSTVIRSKIVEHRIDVVITFDDKGVSGHKNHISLYNAVRKLKQKRQLSPGVDAYCLESVPLWRKYLLLLDLPLSCMLQHRLLFVSSWQGVGQAQQAMSAHWSQLVWFRVLYIIFSRYMVINTLQPITDWKIGGHRR